uniref:Uncharacterized protein n=1 Tax=Mola mola TaxID=94237 RepID=A0A3Q3VIN5_MOLML
MDEDNKLQFPSLPATKEELLDWAYPMRRDMQEILPGLFLGPYSAAMKSKLPILERQGITHVVCVRQDIEANFIKPNFPHTFSCLATGGKHAYAFYFSYSECQVEKNIFHQPSFDFPFQERY